jgi:signal transduction histidine kinase
VDVQVSDGFRVNDRLAAEAFQIITEGLSNVRRHTQSKSVTVRVGLTPGTLKLEVENAIESGRAPTENFLPKSISSRARALGGKANIETDAASTRVIVEIPL